MEAFHKRLLKLQTELAVLIQDVESSFEGVPLAPARRRGRPPKVKVEIQKPPAPANDAMIEELENFLNEIEKTVTPPPVEATRPKRGRPKKVVVEVPVEAPAETPAETPVEAPAETPVEAPAETPKPKRALKLKPKSL